MMAEVKPGRTSMMIQVGSKGAECHSLNRLMPVAHACATDKGWGRVCECA